MRLIEDKEKARVFEELARIQTSESDAREDGFGVKARCKFLIIGLLLTTVFCYTINISLNLLAFWFLRFISTQA